MENEEWKMKNEEWKNRKLKIIKMEVENIIVKKSYDFAKRIVKLYLFLSKEKNEYILSKQILRSGTSIGANVEEAQGGQSKRDFIAKTQISLKEAKETRYWLRLLRDTDILETELANSLINDCEEILYILTAILKSSKRKWRNEKWKMKNEKLKMKKWKIKKWKIKNEAEGKQKLIP